MQRSQCARCVAACCSVLQNVAAVAVCCNVLQCVSWLVAFGVRCTYATFAVCALCCSVLQRVAACCSVLQHFAAFCSSSSVLQCVVVCRLVGSVWI